MNFKIYRLLIIFLIFSCDSVLLSQDKPCDQTIEGKIYDMETSEPLPFATVKIQETGVGVAADSDGYFIIEDLCYTEVHLEIQFLGYKKVVHHHDFHHNDPSIFLAHEKTLLEGIVIEESKVDAFKTLSTQNLEVDKISLLSSSVSRLTEQFSGVTSLKTGANISKPIVHGLHSNRVLVINDGLRHAYQLWGEGHAPEIDPSHVSDIEVVKGAATVKYGPEALGGVILYNTKRPELDKKLHGSLGSSFKTNGRSPSAQLNLSQGSHRFAWSASGFGVLQADLTAPDYNLSNTGRREYGGSFNTLFHQPKYELQVSGSYLDQQLGILRGSIVGNLRDLQNAIERGVPSPTLESTFDIQNPHHDIQHGLLRSNFSAFFGDQILKIQYGVQRNIRKEFDVRRGELNDRPVIDLELVSHNLDIEWIQAEKGSWTGRSGIQLYTQKSVNEPGSNPINFVPDYDVINIGAFSIQSLELNKSVVELGVRLDHQNLNVIDTIRDVTFYDNEVDYTNVTFTLGFRHKLNESLSLFSNLGTAWRPPNVAELYSFGYHFSRVQFGLWRYDFQPNIITPLTQVFDQTDREVPSERSLKLVTGLELNNRKFQGEFIFHINRINDYIFLRPFGVTTNVAGTFPFFLYQQTNALFLGSDWDIRYNHGKYFRSEAKLSYVYALETTNNQAFIEIPPLSAKYTLDYTKDNLSWGISIDYTAQQWNAPPVIEPEAFNTGQVEVSPDEIFDFIAAPDAYVLLGAKVSYQYQALFVQLTADNLLNTTYRSYTDRLRYFADAPGRNLTLSLNIKF